MDESINTLELIENLPAIKRFLSWCKKNDIEHVTMGNLSVWFGKAPKVANYKIALDTFDKTDKKPVESASKDPYDDPDLYYSAP